MRKEFLRIDRGKKIENEKEFLSDLWLTAAEGEITEIIGNRIRELECLQSVLGGYDSLSSGNVYLHEVSCDVKTLERMLRRETCLICEPPEYVNELTISENFCGLNSRPGPFFSNPIKNREILTSYLKAFGLDIRPEDPVSCLSQIQMFQLVLINLYYKEIKAVVINLSFCNLTKDELEELFPLLVCLKEKGLTFLLLSDKPLPLHFPVDRMTVVKNGVTVMDLERPAGRNIRLTDALVSHTDESEYFDPCNDEAEDVLNIKSVRGETVSIDKIVLRKGEAAIIFSSTSDHKKELFQLLTGENRVSSGTILLEGREINSFGREKRMKAGLLCVENIMSPGFLSDKMSVFDNYVFLKGMENRRVWWNPRYRKLLRKDLENELGKKALKKKIPELSSIKQQKLKYMSCRLFHPKVLVCLDPFSSVDQETECMTIRIMREMTRMGTAVLILSGRDLLSDSQGATAYVLNQDGRLLSRDSLDFSDMLLQKKDHPYSLPVPETDDTDDHADITSCENENCDAENDGDAFWF